MSGHERERLSAYLDGELAPGEHAAVDAHLAACAECTAFLADLAAADQAAAALPAEPPEGYFDTFPVRVRARLQPRRTSSPPRRVPAWMWAAAAALLLAVITPLTLRQPRPTAAERPTRTAAPAVSTKAEADRSRAPEPRAEVAPPTAPRSRPTPPVALPRAAQAPAAPGPAPGAAPRESKGGTTERFLAREAPAPPAHDQATLQTQAEVEAEAAVGAADSQDAASREKAAGVAPRSTVTAEAAPPLLSAASAGRASRAAALEEQEDAFRRLEAARPRSAAGWRRVREQWNALAAAEADPVRADEARVRAVIAAREAWRARGDDADEVAFRAQAESYLRRDDARQKPRVEGLLAEATARPAP